MGAKENIKVRKGSILIFARYIQGSVLFARNCLLRETLENCGVVKNVRSMNTAIVILKEIV
jgi:hypothetical protein